MTPTDVRIPRPGGGALKAALALPDGEGPHPGVVVLHEAFGLNADIRRIAGRLASEGYGAVAPDLYSAGGNRALCLARLMTDPNGERYALDEVETARRWLAERPDVDERRLAVIGFCMGGGFALGFAAKGGVKAASSNYGRVPKDRSRLEGACPIVAAFGGRDRFLSKDPERLETHLSALGIPHDVKVYEGVGHSFMSFDNAPTWMLRVPSPMHVGYDETAAEDNWKRILAFFAEHVTA